jgi:hypothetical protein
VITNSLADSVNRLSGLDSDSKCIVNYVIVWNCDCDHTTERHDQLTQLFVRWLQSSIIHLTFTGLRAYSTSRSYDLLS